MKRLLIIFIFLLQVGEIFSQQAIPADSVQKVLNTLPDTARLTYLVQLTQNSSQNTAINHVYARLLEAEALRQHDDHSLAEAWYCYARNYYSTNNDSMRYWINKAEPLFIRIERWEDLCRMIGWSAYAYTRQGEKEKAIKTIEHLKKLSEELSFPEGLEMADQAMADMYFSNKLYDVGKELYLNVLVRMEEREAPVFNRLNILRQLFNNLPDPKERIIYLKKAEEMIGYCTVNGIERLTDDSFVSNWEYIIQRNYAREYVMEDNLAEAWIHLQKAQELSDKYQISRAHAELAQMYLMYYDAKGDYAKALDYVDILETWYRDRSPRSLSQILITKANIYLRQGKKDSAISVYQELLILKDSISQESFNEQLADVHTRYEVEKLAKEKMQIEEEARHTRTQLAFLIGGCVFLLIMILLLANLFRLSERSKKSMQLAKEKAEEADHMKSAFLANMNHEIRTPLNAIVGFSQILVEEDDENNRREFAEVIQNNNELLQQLIGDVLDFSKIESNSMQLVYSNQDLPVLMKDVYQTMHQRMTGEVELILDPCIPFVLETDRNRLIQILTNLLTNAIKHTRKGYIRFGYRPEEQNVTFYVEDTGEGIPADQLGSIFDRFVQLANSHKGVGLGLAICRGLVSKMDGRIWVTSQVEEGTTFYMAVPKVKPS